VSAGGAPVVRVLVADDHPAFRAGLRLMLTAADDVVVVAEAESGSQVLAMVAEHRPDVVVMDLRMPGLDGI
jgi:DNA-binding NarL/FixJ family response regulator